MQNLTHTHTHIHAPTDTHIGTRPCQSTICFASQYTQCTHPPTWTCGWLHKYNILSENLMPHTQSHDLPTIIHMCPVSTHPHIHTAV